VALPMAERPWMDATLSPDKRTELLLAAMTLEEKVRRLPLDPRPSCWRGWGAGTEL